MIKNHKIPSSQIVVTDYSTRPLRDGTDNHVLNNEETLKELIKNLDKYEADRGTPAPLDPSFRTWLKEASEAINGGEISLSDYVKQTVARRINIAQAVKNTNNNLNKE